MLTLLTYKSSISRKAITYATVARVDNSMDIKIHESYNEILSKKTYMRSAATVTKCLTRQQKGQRTYLIFIIT